MSLQHYLLSKKLYPKLYNSIITIRYNTSSTTTTTNNNNNHDGNHINGKNSSSHRRYGLFGIKNLCDPDDFQKLTSIAIENIQSIRKFIAQTNISSRSSSSSLSLSSSSLSSSLSVPSSSIKNNNYSSSHINANTTSNNNNNEDEKISIHPSLCLLLLDEISCQLCGIIDVAELCRNIHTSDKYKFEAEATFDQLSKVIHQLNNDDTLYQRLLSISIHHINDNDDNDKKVKRDTGNNNNSNEDDYDGHDDCSDKYVLTEEERLFVMDMKREFESEGKIYNEFECSIEIHRAQSLSSSSSSSSSSLSSSSSS
jgi:hypothetical protein